MISIVIVSHSLHLARGVNELAQQMANGRVPIAIAAGIDDPENPIGTDALAILSAIESVYSAEGVLVFMDMGSALLSTEMALELLDDEKKPHVHLVAAPVVEGALSAVVCAAAGLSAETAIAEAMTALEAKQSHLQTAPVISSVPAKEVAEQTAASVSFTWQIKNPNGIHARPAAKIVTTASAFQCALSVQKHGETASARSLNALAKLNIRQDDSVVFLAEGSDAQQAIDALFALAQSHFGEANEIDAAPTHAAAIDVASVSVSGAVSGLVANEGIAFGHVRWFTSSLPEISHRSPVHADEEAVRLETALHAVIAELRQKSVGPEGEIFAAHELMLMDPDLRALAQTKIEEGEQAEFAWLNTMSELAQQYHDMDNAYLREREADVDDLMRQVLGKMCGQNTGSFVTDGPCILLAKDLLPSQVAGLNKAHILGICLCEGGKTSHSAILARAMGIPTLVKATDCHEHVVEGQSVILDCTKGLLWYAPDMQTRQLLEQQHSAQQTARRMTQEKAHLPAFTKNGQPIAVLANIGGLADIPAALANGAEGVGLFRTEFLFSESKTLPDEEEQYHVYCQVAAAFGDHSVTIRTLDIGGDKPLAACPVPVEENPFLGLRGIRLCLARPEIFTAQLRALLRAGQKHANLQIMFPMIASLDEILRVKTLLEKEALQLNIPRSDWPKTGIMIEVPAAVMMAETLAQHVDFFSIGTNDLTQYLMAADRGNSAVAELVDYRNPAVMKAITLVCRAGHLHNIPVSMCGEMAGDTEQTHALIELGLEKFSASAALLPQLKEKIRSC